MVNSFIFTLSIPRFVSCLIVDSSLSSVAKFWVHLFGIISVISRLADGSIPAIVTRLGSTHNIVATIVLSSSSESLVYESVPATWNCTNAYPFAGERTIDKNLVWNASTDVY